MLNVDIDLELRFQYFDQPIDMHELVVVHRTLAFRVASDVFDSLLNPGVFETLLEGWIALTQSRFSFET